MPPALQLARVIARNADALTRGAPLANAFWSSRPHQTAELRTWLHADETRAQLERAASGADPVDPTLLAALALLRHPASAG